MQSGSQARTAANSVTSSLSYIDELISGATSSGQYSVVVDATLLNTSMINTLVNTYGYTVKTNGSDFMGSYPSRYIISW